MVEKTRRSLTVLRRCQEADREELNYWIRRYSDAEELKKGATSGQSRQQSPAVQENTPSGWASHLSHVCSTQWGYFALKSIFERCYLNPSSACSYLFVRDHLDVFVCTQKFTGSFYTGLCLDMFPKKSGRKLVSLQSSHTHRHLYFCLCKDLCRQNPRSSNAIGPPKNTRKIIHKISFTLTK